LLIKNFPYLNNALSYIILKLPNTLVCVYFLGVNYKLVIPFSSFYSKFEKKLLESFNAHLLKSVSIHWVRVIFRGKGFRVRKFRGYNKLTFNFGRSHWTKIGLTTNFFFKKMRRQNYMCLIKSHSMLKDFRSCVKIVKRLNVYTKRGLRLKKQYILRRFGKISQVVSSLH
jgi:hypothetical protein